MLARILEMGLQISVSATLQGEETNSTGGIDIFVIIVCRIGGGSQPIINQCSNLLPQIVHQAT